MEAALLNSSATHVFSDVAQQQHNTSRAALIYVNAVETNRKALAKGHIPLRVTAHKEMNQLTKI